MNSPAKIFVPLLAALMSSGAGAQEANSNAVCSVLLTGVQNGSVDIDYFETICNFVTERQKVLDAIALGDIEALNKLVFDGEQLAAVGDALEDADVASSFFEKSRGKDTSVFFGKAVAAGFNPNMLVGPRGTDRTSLLYHALRAGNIKTAIVLLGLGATPHTYDALWGEEYYRKAALMPLVWIEFLSATREEKSELVVAMYEAGLAWPSKDVFAQETATSEAEEARTVIAAAYESLGRTVPDLSGPRSQVVCEKVVSPKKIDWCAQLASIPAEFADPNRGGTVTDFGLGRLVGIYDDKFHFLARVGTRFGASFPVGIASVDISGDTVQLFYFASNGAGLGHCSRLRRRSNGEEPGDFSDGDRNAQCWRRFILRRDFATQQYFSPYDWPWEAKGIVAERQFNRRDDR